MPGIGAKIMEGLTGMMAGKAGDLVKNITGLVDESRFSGEEKAAHELKVIEAVNKYNLDVLSESTKQVISEDTAVTDRWKSDMESDSWLSKNTRPIGFLSLLVFLFVIIILDSVGFKTDFNVKPGYISLLETLLVTVTVAYYGSRGLEKFKSMHEVGKQNLASAPSPASGK